MTSPTIEPGCTGKHSYPTPQRAYQEVQRVKRNKRVNTLGVYRCEFCGGFHVGNKRKRNA